MVVGLTVVALGTSTPEMMVSAIAALSDSPGLALGNVVGSNITNIALVAGGAALVMPIIVASETIRREFSMLLAVTVLGWLLLLDRHLGRGDAIILLVATALVLMLIVRTALAARRRDPLKKELEANPSITMANSQAGLLAVGGLIFMVLASRMVVSGAIGIATAFGVSELVIGLTIVAVGTSLPELATSIVSVRRGQPDIAIGNVLGSNIFNLLPVLAAAALAAPFAVDAMVLQRDYPVMGALTLVLLMMCVGWRGQGQITRGEGGLLVAAFAAYQGLLYVTAQ